MVVLNNTLLPPQKQQPVSVHVSLNDNEPLSHGACKTLKVPPWLTVYKWLKAEIC